MTLKVEGKEWGCRMQCQSNCCSSVFLKVTPEQRVSLESKGYFIAKHDFTEFRWLGFHKAFTIQKLDNGDRKVTVNKEYRFIFNKFEASDFLYVADRCIQLMKDNKCKVYRNRPMICKVGKCTVFDDSPNLQWFAENGHLKDQIEKYRKGELKKW